MKKKKSGLYFFSGSRRRPVDPCNIMYTSIRGGYLNPGDNACVDEKRRAERSKGHETADGDV